MMETGQKRSARTGEASGFKQGTDSIRARVFQAYGRLAGVRGLLTVLDRSTWSAHQEILSGECEEGLPGEQHLIEIIDKQVEEVMDLLIPPEGETTEEAAK